MQDVSALASRICKATNYNAGLVGPWMIGAIKKSSGNYVAPMTILAAVNGGAVLYFAILLKFLPIEKKPPEMRPVAEDEEALVTGSRRTLTSSE